MEARAFPSPKEFKIGAPVSKVMASVFWDSEGVLMIDYLQRGETVSGDYYAILWRKLKEAIEVKRCGKLSNGVMLLQDNAPAHTAQVAIAVAARRSFEILSHPAYSPDLPPSNFYLFPQLKACLRRRH